MKKLIALLIKEKGKTIMNEWENHDSGILRALYSVYKKTRTILFLSTSVVKSYKFLNKLISYV